MAPETFLKPDTRPRAWGCRTATHHHVTRMDVAIDGAPPRSGAGVNG
ncbi:hypothetical protein QF000_007906 [Paraburkholderia atlantica]